MPLELITTTDMKQFMQELLNEQKKLLEKPAASHSREFMTTTEVCALLRITAGTLRNYRVKEIVKYVRIGGNLLYRRLDIEMMLSKKRA